MAVIIKKNVFLVFCQIQFITTEFVMDDSHATGWENI
jgi:hypothetical protein